MKETLTTKLNAKRWATYSAAGVAALAAGADTAEADITVVDDMPMSFTNVDDSDFASGTLGSGVNFSFINDDGRVFLSIFDADDTDILVGSVVGFTSDGSQYINNLANGVNISTQAFLAPDSFIVASEEGFDNSQFIDASGFIGFRFDVTDDDDGEAKLSVRLV